MSLSNDAEVKVLNHIFRNAEAVYTPGAQYISLHTGNPGEANDGGNEVSGYNYARVLSSDKFGAAADGEIATDTDITFPTATGGSWGQVTHIGIYDASEAGNLVAYGTLTVPKTITDGDTFVITSGNLTITLN